MKQPARWNTGQAKTASPWAGVVKTARAWAGSGLTKTTSPAVAYVPSTKTPAAYVGGQYGYDSFLLYDCPVSYDGAPDPINTKIPTNWSLI